MWGPDIIEQAGAMADDVLVKDTPDRGESQQCVSQSSEMKHVVRMQEGFLHAFLAQRLDTDASWSLPLRCANGCAASVYLQAALILASLTSVSRA